MSFHWNSPLIRHLIQTSLKEDAARHDITTLSLIPKNIQVEAAIISNQKGVVCGLPFASLLFKALSSNIAFHASVREGQLVRRGTRLALIRGHAQAILSGERTALNAVQHLSGIATLTHVLVKRLGRTQTKLLDTRKTLPGWRALQKYAVHCGGGTNHRSTLAEAILVKDNHLKVLRLAGRDWLALALKLKAKKIPLEVEVQNEDDFREVLHLKPDVVLLDNVPPARLKAMIRFLHQEIPQVKIEISGGVKPEDLGRLRHLGADRISMGRLTHSTPAFDCSLDILRVLS